MAEPIQISLRKKRRKLEKSKQKSIRFERKQDTNQQWRIIVKPFGLKPKKEKKGICETRGNIYIQAWTKTELEKFLKVDSDPSLKDIQQT